MPTTTDEFGGYRRIEEGANTIPTVILWGLIFGRWWKTTLIGSAIAWPAVLVIDGVMGLEPGQLMAAALLAVANAVVGVAAHQGVLSLARRARRNGRRSRTDAGWGFAADPYRQSRFETWTNYYGWILATG